MKTISLIFLFISLLTVPASFSFANGTPQFGKAKSDQYFIQRKRKVANIVNVKDDPHNVAPVAQRAPESATHYLALQAGFFIDDKAHRWGEKSTDTDIGKWNLGVTYQIGEWVNSMDLHFRADFQSFKVDGESANKMSLMSLVTFPDVRSGFPLYFGAGAGVGIFFDQVDDESSLSFDYQLVLGGRLLNVYESIGLIAEAGVKNHIFLTSKGQFNGYFFTTGAIFNF